MKKKRDERPRGTTVKGNTSSQIGVGEEGWAGAEKEKGRGRGGGGGEGRTDTEGKDRWRGWAEIGLPADKIAVFDRFLRRPNWARGLRGNQSES